MSERVVLGEFGWKYHIFLTIKSYGWDLKLFVFNYSNRLVLGSVEKYFLGLGGYISLKGATTGLLQGCFAEFDRKYHIL